MSAASLPNRRNEAWKFSDLRAAVGDATPVLRDGRDIIERLAPGTERTAIGAGETLVVVDRVEGAYGVDARSCEFDVADGATLMRIVIQSGAGLPLSVARVRLGANAKLRQFVLAEGARLARIETHVSVEGQGAEVELNGAYMCGAGRHADLTSVIEHKVDGCTTKQLVHGVALKGGRGVFQGKIVVEHGAQKTDARQHHHGLLLEDGAEIFAKPELMIHADDVSCAHGNAMGGLDESALFYMRARGIPEAAARALLIEAFLTEAIPDRLPDELNEELLGRIRAWLNTAPARAPAVQEEVAP